MMPSRKIVRFKSKIVICYACIQNTMTSEAALKDHRPTWMIQSRPFCRREHDGFCLCSRVRWLVLVV